MLSASSAGPRLSLFPVHRAFASTAATAAAGAQGGVEIAGLLTSGSKSARAAQHARERAARVAALLRSPGAAVAAVAAANVALYGAWKTAFWCASSRSPRRSAFGGKMLDFMERHFTCSVDNLRAGRVHTLVTSAFSHNDVGSLLSTLNSIFSCGLPIAQMAGSKALGQLLLAGSASSMLALVGADWVRARKAQKDARSQWWKPPVDPFHDTRTTREKQQQRAQEQQVARLGGSGAGTGMLTAFAMAFPHSILMLNGYVRLPVLVEVIATWLYDAANIGREHLTGVAHVGHFAGALAGAMCFLLGIRNRKAS